jgi:hypothetical protein
MVRRKRQQNKLIAIPIISGLIIAGVWFGPHIHRFNLSLEDGEFKSSIEISADDHEESVAATPEKDWQKTVTWGIGALNGLFGVILLGKKIISK